MVDSSVEERIRDSFFEIQKSFASKRNSSQQRQMYVSHECLHQLHPIFKKVSIDCVKFILQNSAIVHLKKGQLLYSSGQTDNILYFILFGKLRLYTRPEKLGQKYLESSLENQQ